MLVLRLGISIPAHSSLIIHLFFSCTRFLSYSCFCSWRPCAHKHRLFQPWIPLLALQLLCEIIITNYPQLHIVSPLGRLDSDLRICFMNLYLRQWPLLSLFLQCLGIIAAPVSLLLSLELFYSYRTCTHLQQFVPSCTSAPRNICSFVLLVAATF